MAVSSAGAVAFDSIEECQSTPPGNQVKKVVIVNSFIWLSKAFSETVYTYLEHGFHSVEDVRGVSDKDRRLCSFNMQRVERKRGPALGYPAISQRRRSQSGDLCRERCRDDRTYAGGAFSANGGEVSICCLDGDAQGRVCTGPLGRLV